MEIEHWSHQHPLTLCNCTKPDTGPKSWPPLRCYGCSKTIDQSRLSNQFYACKSCDYRLHKLCADLPPDQLHHPYHPSHPLSIRVAQRKHKCTFCYRDILGFNLCCDPCGFYLDSHCATEHSTSIKYEDAGHMFFIMEAKHYTYYPCDRCNDSGWDTHLFKCVVPNCFRSFHFHCAPLPFPKTINVSACHIHDLTLTESYVQDWANDQYCDVCETMRNPKHPVYCCIDCGFVAHISCSVNEVLLSIIEEYEKEAKLREDIEHDLGLHRIRMRIQEARNEENRLVAELEKITARLEILKGDRAEYVLSTLYGLDTKESSSSCQSPA